jgi:hypothetical protein
MNTEKLAKLKGSLFFGLHPSQHGYCHKFIYYDEDNYVNSINLHSPHIGSSTHLLVGHYVTNVSITEDLLTIHFNLGRITFWESQS